MTEPLNKKQLYDLVWKKPLMEVAKAYGLSDRGLAKLCERNGIPVPPRGYWARKQAGYKIGKPPLITLEPKEPDTIILFKRAAFQKSIDQEKSEEPTLPEEIQQAMIRESLPKNRIKVPKTLSHPHPIVGAWIKDEERRWDNYRKFDGYWGSQERPNALERRRRRIISAFLKALEARGFKVEPEREFSRCIWIMYERDKIGFTIEERIRHIRRELTEKELEERPHSKQKWTQIAEATGKFILRLSSESRPRKHDSRDFHDSDDCPLETQLNNVIAAIIEQLWWAKMHRMAKEEAEHQRWLEQKARWRAEELLKAEQKRRAELEAKASDWKKAQDIREYIAAVEDACRNNRLTIDPDTLADWIRWALAHANDLDCIASKDPLIELAPENESGEEDEEV